MPRGTSQAQIPSVANKMPPLKAQLVGEAGVVLAVDGVAVVAQTHQDRSLVARAKHALHVQVVHHPPIRQRQGDAGLVFSAIGQPLQDGPGVLFWAPGQAQAHVRQIVVTGQTVIGAQQPQAGQQTQIAARFDVHTAGHSPFFGTVTGAVLQALVHEPEAGAVGEAERTGGEIVIVADCRGACRISGGQGALPVVEAGVQVPGAVQAQTLLQAEVAKNPPLAFAAAALGRGGDATAGPGHRFGTDSSSVRGGSAAIDNFLGQKKFLVAHNFVLQAQTGARGEVGDVILTGDGLLAADPDASLVLQHFDRSVGRHLARLQQGAVGLLVVGRPQTRTGREVAAVVAHFQFAEVPQCTGDQIVLGENRGIRAPIFVLLPAQIRAVLAHPGFAGVLMSEAKASFLIPVVEAPEQRPRTVGQLAKPRLSFSVAAGIAAGIFGLQAQ